MPIINPSEDGSIVPSQEPTGQRRGRRRTRQLINQQGVPRFDDLITARMLESTPVISLAMNTAKRQATAVPFEIAPCVENPTRRHENIADRLYNWFDGNFNRNNESWDYFLKLLLNDLISIDTAPIELVPTEEQLPHPQTGEPAYWLSEMYAVDGSIVSKNLTEKDTVPNPPEPAYYKFGNLPNVSQRFVDRSSDLTRLFRNQKLTRFVRGGKVEPVPYSRDEMTVVEENPRPAMTSAYGFGIVQQARHWAEILLNQDLSNIKHFSDDEYAKGILNIGQSNQNQIEQFREYWKEEVRGDTDTKLPIVGADDAEFIQFNPSLKELQYLESQQWYSELVWYLFGQTQSEIGQTEDANVSTSEHDTFQVFINTTKPRLQTIEEEINNFILPKLRDYWIVDGELEFQFAFDEHSIMQERLREKRRDDLQNGVTTANRVLEAEGKDPLPWGDAPTEAVAAFSREHPEWVMKNWADVEDVPEPADPDPGGLFSGRPDVDRDGPDDDDSKGKPTTKDGGGEFTADVFRIVADKEHEFDDGTVLAIGVDFPNSDVYVDWKIDEWPDDSQSSGAHVSIYATIEDANAVAQGEIEMLDSLSADAEKEVADTIISKRLGIQDQTESQINRSDVPDEGKPFAGYDDFEDCVSDNQDKDDPEAFCGWLESHVKDGDLPESRRDCLRDALQRKDPLRNERGDYPNLSQHIDEARANIASVFEDELSQLETELEDVFPDERQTDSAKVGLSIDPGRITEAIDLKNALTGAVVDVLGDAMETQAEDDINALEDEIEDRVGGDATAELSFDVRDSFAYERMQRVAAADMVTVESTVKDKIRDTMLEVADDGGNVQDATEALRDRIDELSDSHARLVARTETLSASRHGSQALGEQSDLIEGKRWNATNDSRTRSWHEAMDGEVVEIENDFTVPAVSTRDDEHQPADYPRSAFTVGDDQPYNCRCLQEQVLRDDMPEAKRVLARFDGVTLRSGGEEFNSLTDRQYEIWQEHGNGEPWAEFFESERSNHSISDLKDRWGTHHDTIQSWQAEVDGRREIE